MKIIVLVLMLLSFVLVFYAWAVYGADKQIEYYEEGCNWTCFMIYHDSIY